MTTYFAFLRAINVTNRFVKMDHLRTLFEEMGCENVETYIQSGNVIFDYNTTQVEHLRKKIEQHLLEHLDFEVPAFLRSYAQLEELTKFWPFDDSQGIDGDTLYVSFLNDPPANDVTEDIQKLSSEVEEFSVVSNHIFWLYHRSKGRSRVTNSKIEKILGQPGTRRNMNTVSKIVKKFKKRI